MSAAAAMPSDSILPGHTHTTTALINHAHAAGSALSTGSESNLSAKDLLVAAEKKSNNKNIELARHSGSKKWRFMRQKSQQIGRGQAHLTIS